MIYPDLAERGVAFDVETHLIAPKAIPPLVCGSVDDAESSDLLDREQAWELFQLLLSTDAIIIGANIAFDMAVMVEYGRRQHGVDLLLYVFQKYDRGEVYDVLIAEMLDAIANDCLGRDPRTFGPLIKPSTGKQVKRYSLEVVTDLVLGRVDAKKNDYWRLRYELLEDLPIADWPLEARQYPVDDAVNTREAALAQAGLIARGDGTTREASNIHAVAELCRAAWALHLGALWGFDVDRPLIEDLIETTEAKIAEGMGQFIDAGIVRGGCKKHAPEFVEGCRGCETKRGSLNTAELKRLVSLAYANGPVAPCPVCNGERKVQGTGKAKINCKDCSGTGLELSAIAALPRTEKGAPMTARDVLVDAGDELLDAYVEWGARKKVISTYGPALLNGIALYPNLPLANLRISYGGVIQLLPRDMGVREGIKARDGFVLSSTDYKGIEMVTWAQVCLWTVKRSRLADALNNGADTHSMLASEMCGRSYDEFLAELGGGNKTFKLYRQACKPINFTCSGGGGVTTIVRAKRGEDFTTVAPDGTKYRGIRFCILMGRAEHCGERKTMDWRDRGRPHIPLCVECCEAASILRETWFRTWPEAEPYFEFITRVVDGPGYIQDFGSKVIRGGVGFCEAANGFYSMLATNGFRAALYAAQKECHDRSSPLWGSRVIAGIHDELIGTHPIDRSNDAARRIGVIMEREMKRFCPDLAEAIEAKPALMRRWYKGAEPVEVDGALVPWEPKN